MDTLVWNEAALKRLLESPQGPVARDLAVRAIRVQNQAKINATGAQVEGAHNPGGRGPRVRTGRLRSSISHRVQQTPGGTLRADIGTNVSYGRYLELGLLPNGRRYPFLAPALPMAR